MKERRSRIQILVDILKLIQRKGGTAKSTHILYGANLSHKRLKLHLEDLIDSDFIEIVSLRGKKYYKITTKGKKFIIEYRKIQEISDAFGVSI